MLKYYTSALSFTTAAIVTAFLLDGARAAFIVLLLAILEISLSFDNAVVNAAVLRHWDARWRGRFIRWGMPVAVFGMRLAFPILIVALAAQLGPREVITLALHNPKTYAAMLKAVHPQIAAFGGAFLMMVFLDFMMDLDKDRHWITWLEYPLRTLAKLPAMQSVVTLIAICFTSQIVQPAEQLSFLLAGVWGFIVYALIRAIVSLARDDSKDGTMTRIVRQGIYGFIYLELLDATFSFDGVIGAFALSHDVFVIALGLGIGAMFVRSMTLHIVDAGALHEYRYLEHGAFWAIGTLAALLLCSAVTPIPETISGVIGAVLIALSLGSSLLAKRKRINNEPFVCD